MLLALTFVAPKLYLPPYIYIKLALLNFLILPTRLCRVWSSGPSFLYCCSTTPPSPAHTLVGLEPAGLVKAVNPVGSGVPLPYHGVARMHPFFKPQGGLSWM